MNDLTTVAAETLAMERLYAANRASIAKWMFIACLYDTTATQQLRVGRILSREEFLSTAIIIGTTPEGVALLAESPYQTHFATVNRVANAGPPGQGIPAPSRIIQ